MVSRLQSHAMGTLTGASGCKAGEPAGATKGESHAVAMTDSQVRAAIFLIERTIARAENPRDINVAGHVTLERLITGALEESEHDADQPSRSTH